MAAEASDAAAQDPAATAPATGADRNASQALADAATPGPHSAARSGFWPLAIGSVGVVFGDIGTSPLYAFREALKAAGRGEGDGGHGEGAAAVLNGIVRADILGVVSLALWALILVVTVKYVLFLMRADNKGEGGVLSLMALAQRAMGRRTLVVFVLGLLGCALFYGDAVITPAVSVLSAVEGLGTIPVLEEHINTQVVLLIAAVLLVGLFAVQARGTAKVATFFGPICAVWFATMGGLGVYHIGDDPGILAAVSPTYGLQLLASDGFAAFMVLGAVFLTVTGAEALIADMGHFGRWPIQAAWLFFCLPCLVLNYFGQGAFALESMEAAAAAGRPFVDQNWFFLMAPEAFRVPLVILAGMATVIASQAVITGAFSLSQQAIQLGLLPRFEIRRTSETQAGQIYLPQVNTLLAVGVLLIMMTFQTSSNLSHAYGLAVSGTMVVTTSMFFIVTRYLWRWSLPLSLAVVAPFLVVDLIFLSANAARILTGGWLPLLIAAALFTIMATWVRGAAILHDKTRRDSVPLNELIEILQARRPHRVPGAAIFLTSDADTAPVALMHNLKHNKVLHERNVILTVQTAETPRVPDKERVSIEPINDDFKRVTIRYGFMESPNVPKALNVCRKQGLKFDIMATSFFLGRRSVIASAHSGMPLWQDKLFIFLMKNAANPTDFFRIPPGRVVEMGAQVTV